MRKPIIQKLFSVLFVLCGFVAQKSWAQTYGNEWINFGQTYYKVKVGASGIYRISASVLQNYGLGSVPGAQFAVFREGAEVPIYVSTNGTFGANDYIAFYGTKANGKMDTELYASPANQPNDDINIISDTAYYFLTFSVGTHERLSLGNALSPNPPTPEPYCWVWSYPTSSFREAHNNGESYSSQQSFYSAKFDKGEGYAIASNADFSIAIPAIQKYNNGPSAKLYFSAFFYRPGFNNMGLSFNNVPLLDTPMSFNNFVKRVFDIPTSNINNTNTVQIFNRQVQQAKLWYPRTFNMSGVNSLDFYVAANNSVQSLYLQNVSPNTVVVDLMSTKLYFPQISSNACQIELDPSSAGLLKKLFYTNSITTIDQLTPVNFRDYSLSSNQGNYLILTDRAYSSIPNGGVSNYANYRSSGEGGGYNVQVIESNELYDQFGYGFEYHPLAIKRFIKSALDSWTEKPRFLFIIGKGVHYPQLTNYLSNPSLYSFPVVPTYGIPGSDNLFAEIGNSSVPAIAIGRISVLNNSQIQGYLDKVKAYEIALKTATVPNLENTLWKKSALHIAGSQGVDLQQSLFASLNVCKATIEDTATGATVTTVGKVTTDVIDNATPKIDSLINSGVQYVTFFGHASAAGFDYNLNNPNNYNSKPKFPIFQAYGCDIAAIFGLSTGQTISESYINSAQGGSIAMISGNNVGWTGNLSAYMQGLYRKIAYQEYSKTLGEQYRKNIETIQNANPTNIFSAIHSQNMLLQGDPGLKAYSPPLPDYYVDAAQVSYSPAIVNTSTDTIEMVVKLNNLGKATNDSVNVYLLHSKVGNLNEISRDSVKVLCKNSAVVTFKIKVNPLTDVGLNNYLIHVNPNESIDEISFQNNQTNLQIFISENSLVPIYPEEFAIVNQQELTLKASSMNPFLSNSRYLFEIDTTEQFNSAFKRSTSLTGMGGVIGWKVPFSLVDSTVYYWRTAVDSLVNGNLIWNKSSFVYLAHGSEGWNQSHYYQFKQNGFEALELDSAQRDFKFDTITQKIKINNKISGWSATWTENYLNNIVIGNGGCVYDGAIQFILFKPSGGQPVMNTGQYNGAAPVCQNRIYHFEFSTANSTSRKAAMDFLEDVPDGFYIMAKSYIYDAWFANVFIDDWKADTLLYGSGKSLYHSLIGLGFSEIDQYTSKKSYIFFGKKGDPTFIPQQEVAQNAYDWITLEADFTAFKSEGTMKSTLIGPASKWKSLLWKVSHETIPSTNFDTVRIFGFQNKQQQVGTLLAQTTNRDTSLNTIDAAQYPFIRLEWQVGDSVFSTPSKMKYWRILYDAWPEAALNPRAHFSFKDSLNQGQNSELILGIENLTSKKMDSMLVRYRLIDAQNVTHDLGTKRFRPIGAFDTLKTEFTFNPSNFRGKNYLFIEANPDNDQPEQYHPNNLGYLGFKLIGDDLNPVMDVTFDGIHILDKDIVSAKPLIKVLIKDENKFSLLTDSSNVRLRLQYPDQSIREIPFDGTICKFIPASSNANGKNEAYVEFRPTLEDGQYRLFVSSKDNAGNLAGNTPGSYQVAFEVINKSTITNVLNYPNPFSTSTQFIFTLTGAEIPSQFKIQIISVSGKVVKEITKAELGPLHVGRNITEYRWDGKDQFGQLLGNGVYLYRVITNNKQGESIEHRKNSTIDQYFKNGYGKLYIMR